MIRVFYPSLNEYPDPYTTVYCKTLLATGDHQHTDLTFWLQAVYSGTEWLTLNQVVPNDKVVKWCYMNEYLPPELR